MNATKLKRTLKSGGHVFGCMLSQMASTRFEQVLSGSTLDYAIIDSEHGSRDRTEIQNLCGMLRRADVTPVVRVPIPKTEWVAMALDAGTAGVLVPYCETVERKIPVMVHQQTIETSTKVIKLGARFVLHSSDGRMLQRIIQQEMNQLRKIAGATAKATKDTVETV